MQITKYEHACLVLENNGKKLILDPGSYGRDMNGFTDVEAIVITHQHDDHCFEAQLDRILNLNPNAAIYAPADACDRLANYSTTAVYHGDWYDTGNFQLEFFGDLHSEIHRSIPIIQNTGVMINDSLYYPGDSYTTPDRHVKLLACPASAPWLKIGDVMDFVAAVKPARSFPTHNALLTEIGHNLNNSRIKLVTEEHGGVFEYLLPGETTSV